VTVEVGFGSGVITPALPVVLAGFGDRKGPVTEVRHDLLAQAVVVRSGGTTMCLLSLDLLMLGGDLAGPLRRAVAAELGIGVGQVMTSCTHTHSGPAATSAVRRLWPMPPDYIDLLIEGCLTAVREASSVAEPARLSYARGPLPAELSMNRRGLPYDPSFSVLDVLRPDGSRVGSIAGVGIHPVALGVTCRAVSGDWITSYRAAFERSSGAPAVLLQGALGDVNPVRDPHTDPDPGGNWETAEVLGTEIADCVRGLLSSCAALPAEVELLPTRVVPLRAGVTPLTVLTRKAWRRVGVELQEWSLGGVRFVSVPGEAFHALGREIERSRDDRAMLAGLASEYHGYLPVPFGSGYEEKMSYGGRFVDRLRQALLEVPTSARNGAQP
jgi:neutral ceramidase